MRRGGENKEKQTTQRHKSTEFVYDKQKKSLVLINTAPSDVGKNVKYDTINKTYKHV